MPPAKHRDRPIEDLPEDVSSLANPELRSLASVWQDQKDRLEDAEARRDFSDRLQREWAIETPTTSNGSRHEYCPVEQVEPQMEQLLRWYNAREKRDVPPEVEAAWLHHRFTQIHPFQDGNGKSKSVSRAGWTPAWSARWRCGEKDSDPPARKDALCPCADPN
jgi:hypothetical protein